MDPITRMMKSQLTEREAIVYLLIESGMGYRDLGKRLGVSHYYISKLFDAASAKVEKLETAGVLSTPEKKD